MTRRGEPIRYARLGGSVNPGISFNSAFLELEAACAAGLDFFRWMSDEYPKWFKIKVIAWFNMHKLVESHTQSAIAEDMKRKNK